MSVNSLPPTLNLPPFGVLAKAPVNALPSSATCWRPPKALRIASAATSPNISSTSFLAPAILSAKVILSTGGASAANDFCLAGLIFSLTCTGFSPVGGIPIFFCKSRIMSTSSPWPTLFSTAPPAFLAMPPTFWTTSTRPSSTSLLSYLSYLLRTGSKALPSRPALAKACMPSLPYFS